MIVVEVGHAHVITFLQLSCELSFCQCHCHFLGEKCGDEVFIYFVKNGSTLLKVQKSLYLAYY
jgi:hypothetical protein